MKQTKGELEGAFDIAAFVRTIVSGRSFVDREEGGVFYTQGDPADAVFLILTGRVKLSMVSAQGKERIVGVLAGDAFFGEGSLSRETRRMATASAMVRSQCVRLTKSAMRRALEKYPRFADFFVSHLLARTLRLEEDLVDQLFNSSEKRLARQLLLMAKFGPDRMAVSIIPKVDQGTLAEIIGTTRSRVNFFMNRFRSRGYIDYGGGGCDGVVKVHRSLRRVLLDG